MSLTSRRERAYYRIFGADSELASLARPGSTLVDIGCSTGTGSPVLDHFDRVVGVDIHLPSITQARESERRSIVVNAHVNFLPFRDKAFDIGVALDVIEHLDHEDGLKMLAEVRRVSDAAVVLTPSGFDPQPAQPGQPWMEHRSGWTPADLTAAGFDVTGHGGPKVLRMSGQEGRFRFGAVGALSAALLARPFRRWPSRCFHLLAVFRDRSS